MSALTITDLGISKKSFNELRAELQAQWRELFGNAIDLSPTSVDGHHLDLECKTIESVSQLLEAVIANFNPKEATGVWLDILGDYKSMKRLEADYSVASVVFSGTEGTEIPADTVVTYAGAPCDFVLQDAITIGDSGKAVGKCKATVLGYVEIITGDWEMVSSSPSGVTCKVLTNEGAGRNDETDDEFRLRQDKFAGYGLATYDKMYAYMAGVVGEGNFSLQVNDEDVSQNDIPPHRFEFVFKNGIGDNDDLAQAVWNCKPAGIKPYGNASGTAVAVNGVKKTMFFSRPVYAKLWLIVEITEYTEESLPENWNEAIVKAVTDFAATEYAPGKDVIPKRLYGPIYKAVPGILDIVVKACLKETEPDVSEYTEERISVNPQTEAVVHSVSVEKQ